MRHPSKNTWTPLSLCHVISSLSYKLQALVLLLPDLTRPFFFYVSERQGFALGVLGHNIGPSFAPVT
jgi:hypothetical protein